MVLATPLLVKFICACQCKLFSAQLLTSGFQGSPRLSFLGRLPAAGDVTTDRGVTLSCELLAEILAFRPPRHGLRADNKLSTFPN